MAVKINDTLYPAKVETILKDPRWNNRAAKQITLEMDSVTAAALFVDDLPWAVEVPVLEKVTADDGSTTVRSVEKLSDMSEYCVAGTITDNRDGTITVKMGKATDGDMLAEVVGEKPRALSEARLYRAAIVAGSNAVERSDADALAVKGIYPQWADLVGQAVDKAGFRFTYNGKLYKTIPANHTFAAEWVPGVGTESLYARIDEAHAGTLEDPIPYEGNMELAEGLYYSQDGVTYLCTRSTGQPVYHALNELVGLYVEVV